MNPPPQPVKSTLPPPTTGGATPPTPSTIEGQAAERVLCAILHATSPFGLYALISSTLVYMVQRKQSRFVAVQALQAMLFQLFVTIAHVILFSFLFAGWLDNFLFAVLILLYPLVGVWAALWLLGKRNFSYPFLGWWAVNWMESEVMTVQPLPRPTERPDDSANAEAFLAGIAHLSVLAGFGSILGPVLWASRRNPSRFFTEQIFQAAIFELVTRGLNLVVFVAGGIFTYVFLIAAWNMNHLPVVVPQEGWQAARLLIAGWVIFLVGFGLITGLITIFAAVSAFRGRALRYPLIGRWLVRYLNR